jgi:hypothetical protein
LEIREIREIKWQKLIKKLNKRNESMSLTATRQQCRGDTVTAR